MKMSSIILCTTYLCMQFKIFIYTDFVRDKRVILYIQINNCLIIKDPLMKEILKKDMNIHKHVKRRKWVLFSKQWCLSWIHDLFIAYKNSYEHVCTDWHMRNIITCKTYSHNIKHTLTYTRRQIHTLNIRIHCKQL